MAPKVGDTTVRHTPARSLAVARDPSTPTSLSADDVSSAVEPVEDSAIT